MFIVNRDMALLIVIFFEFAKLVKINQWNKLINYNQKDRPNYSWLFFSLRIRRVYMICVHICIVRPMGNLFPFHFILLYSLVPEVDRISATDRRIFCSLTAVWLRPKSCCVRTCLSAIRLTTTYGCWALLGAHYTWAPRQISDSSCVSSPAFFFCQPLTCPATGTP